MKHISHISADNINENFLNKKTLIVSMRGSGKSFLINSILNNMYNSEEVNTFNSKLIIISPTELISPSYTSLNLGQEILYNIDNLNDIYNTCCDLQYDKNVIIIFDDCFGGYHSTNELIKLFLNLNITIIITIQYPITFFLRLKFNYLLSGGEDFISSRRRLYDLCFNEFINYNTFNNLMNNTIDYKFLFANIKKLQNSSKQLNENKKDKIKQKYKHKK